MEDRKNDSLWRRPILDVAGQSAFWDNQADIYESADMTVDNAKEMEVVLDRYREVSTSCVDLVTLGGAVGCRDPKMIIEDLIARGEKLPAVFFNDLSPLQVKKARESVLLPLTKSNDLSVFYLPGEIKKVCQVIPAKPRRLIVGVYNCHSFFNALPAQGYPNCGFDEYLKNSEILGRDFLMEWVRLDLTNGKMFYSGLRVLVGVGNGPRVRGLVKNTIDLSKNISSNASLDNVTALQIIGRHPEKQGFFISHWYTPPGFYRMLRSVFPATNFSIGMQTFAKGMVFTVDPIDVEEVEGVVTVLNNVIGNVLPDEQVETLSAIKKIIVRP